MNDHMQFVDRLDPTIQIRQETVHDELQRAVAEFREHHCRFRIAHDVRMIADDFQEDLPHQFGITVVGHTELEYHAIDRIGQCPIE